MEHGRLIARLLNRAADDPDILAVMLYGSLARGEATPESDVDVCLVVEQQDLPSAQLSAKRLAYLQEIDLDIQVFQQLPIYVRQRILKEGQVLFVRDEDRLYEVAYRTVQAFEDFRPRYQEYLREVQRARS